MKIIVCGGRHYANEGKVNEMLDSLLADAHGMKIAQGGASGADELALDWAKANCDRVEWVTFKADWKTHGRSAGPKRNQQMLETFKPDMVLAFPGGRGTADMVRRAKLAGVRTMEVK